MPDIMKCYIMVLRIMKNEKENVIASDFVVLDHCASWFNLTAECLAGTNTALRRVWKEFF